MVGKIFPETPIHFVIEGSIRSLSRTLNIWDKGSGLGDGDFRSIANTLGAADVVGLSCMSEHATMVKRIISDIRKINPGAFFVWGGTHVMADPDDAIAHADAICISEGELAFNEFLEKFRDGEDYLRVSNFWFRKGSELIKNPCRPLLTNDEMSELPHPLFGEKELIYKVGKGFTPISDGDYLDWEALTYNTMWTRGCPFKCTYCGNSRFLEIDRGYGRIRHPSVDYMISEIKEAVGKRPFIRSVSFYDDCLISVSTDVLEEFARKLNKEVGLPFAVYGVTPAHIRREKIQILIENGMARVRLGIQSGSDRVLKFFKRPHRPGLIEEATDILGEFNRGIFPPIYDIMCDIPIETHDDIVATLRLINNLPRPFCTNLFSVRSIPNTELERQLAELSVGISDIKEEDYRNLAPTYANMLLYLVSIVRVPEFMFERLVRNAKPAHESSKSFGLANTFLKIIFWAQRAYYHIRFRDFTVVFGRFGWVLWRLRIL
mgnify:CR=1 FL=1